ncbi:ATPase H(+)-transporting accessory protein 2 [Contarinia nasturtii]|uniref:ATPase H(+)-transporting accessory protein 2 n=1 Tax=Contarinia nasturtii TaxID=265458 RepID=UPI0012D49BE3|nr:ATPase H(+)-transporting accessory protein 2 [Contarinia nasturtii]
MLKNILVILSLFAAAYGSGKLTVLESPEQILFKKADKLDGKYMGHVFSACTGHSISESVPLKMRFTSPFDLAENVCLININGVKEFTPQNVKPKSEIDVYGTENSNEVFVNKLYEEDSSIVNINLDNGLETLSTMQDWCETPLKPENSKLFKSLKGEKNVVMEAAIVMSVLSEATCKMPAFLQIDCNIDSTKSRDKDLVPLFEAFETFGQKYQENSNGLGLLAIFTTVEQQTHKRSRREAGITPKFEDLNLADSYSEDYPVIFNIILWFGVLIAFSMLAICYAIATMDPGRDSIIYRMTSTRMKKDN